MVALAPPASVPRSHETHAVPERFLVGVADTKVVLNGRKPSTVTSEAGFVPLVVAVTV